MVAYYYLQEMCGSCSFKLVGQLSKNNVLCTEDVIVEQSVCKKDNDRFIYAALLAFGLAFGCVLVLVTAAARRPPPSRHSPAPPASRPDHSRRTAPSCTTLR